MYSGEGDLVADFSKEKEFLCLMKQFQKCDKLFLSAEDKNFFSHQELMPKGYESSCQKY